MRKLKKAHTLGRTVVLAMMIAASAFATPSPTQTENLRLLLVTQYGTDYGYLAWVQELGREGVPFDTYLAGAGQMLAGAVTSNNIKNQGGIDASWLSNGNTGYYNAIVFDNSFTRDGVLTPAQLSTIQTYEQTFGVKEVDAYVWPSATYGLNTPPNECSSVAATGVVGPCDTISPVLTAAGLSTFPYLNSLKYDPYEYGYLTTPISTTNFTPLIQSSNGATLVGIYTPTNGGPELVSTVNVGPTTISSQLLIRGELAWATEGIHLGFWRNYLSVQIDDVFLPDDAWDTSTHTTDVTGTKVPAIRMTSSDVARMLNWQIANNFKFTLAFNGFGYDSTVAGNGSDPLGTAFFRVVNQFNWINHTYSHASFDLLENSNTGAFVTPYRVTPAATMVNEISKNIAFAKTHLMNNFNPSELITGEYSGLGLDSGSCHLTGNATYPFPSYVLDSDTTPVQLTGVHCAQNVNLPTAFANMGILYAAADSSRPGFSLPIKIGAPSKTITVPRLAVNIFYNAGTIAEQLDEYNYKYTLGEGCINTAVTTCNTTPLTWEQYVALQVQLMMINVLANNPNPFTTHQSNYAQDGIAYLVLSPLLTQYKIWFKVPVVQVSLSAASLQQTNQAAWSTAIRNGTVTASRLGSTVTITNTGSTSVPVPIAGTTVGTAYGDNGTHLSGWTTLNANASITLTIK